MTDDRKIELCEQLKSKGFEHYYTKYWTENTDKDNDSFYNQLIFEYQDAYDNLTKFLGYKLDK